MSGNGASRWARLATPEMLTAVSALVIGACALVIAFYEVRIMRADQRSSVVPIVELGSSTYRTTRDEADEPVAFTQLEFNAENVGIGPARIVDFRVTVDATPVTTWGEVVQALLGDESSNNYRIVKREQLIGRTLPAGRNIDMFRMRGDDLPDTINASMDRLDFEICFCSIYNECWTTGFQHPETGKQVAGCKPGPDSFHD